MKTQANVFFGIFCFLMSVTSVIIGSKLGLSFFESIIIAITFSSLVGVFLSAILSVNETKEKGGKI